MSKKFRICCIPMILYLSTQFPSNLGMSIGIEKIPELVKQVSKINIDEKRASPAFDTVMKADGWHHYRVLFWVPIEAKKLIPYADDGVNTNVSSHGPVERWSVQEIDITNNGEKLVFVFVPKTFVYLYGDGFEKVIHLRYS